MSRRSLRPQLNKIRTWVRQGRTDAWIAHQLEVTVQQVQAFKREHDLEAGDEGGAPEEVDLRASDDEQIAVELEEEERRRQEEEAEAARKAVEEAERKEAERKVKEAERKAKQAERKAAKEAAAE